jgi:hypothetical protein
VVNRSEDKKQVRVKKIEFSFVVIEVVVRVSTEKLKGL